LRTDTVEHKNVLWIDDEPDFIFDVADEISLENNTIKFEFASSLSIAISKLKKKSYGLILLDIYNIPVSFFKNENKKYSKKLELLVDKYQDRTGIAFSQFIREGELDYLFGDDFNKIPIIMTSGFPQKAITSEESDLNLNGVSFVSKADFMSNHRVLAIEIHHRLHSSSFEDSGKDCFLQNEVDSSGVRRVALKLAQMQHDNILELVATRDGIKNIIDFIGKLEIRLGGQFNNNANHIFNWSSKKVISNLARLKKEISISDSKNFESSIIANIDDVFLLSRDIQGFTKNIIPHNLRELSEISIKIAKTKELRDMYPSSTRKLLYSAKQLRKFLCQYDLENILLRIEEMLQEAELVSSYFTNSCNKLNSKEVFSLGAALEKAIEAARSYSEIKKVDIEFEYSGVDFNVKGTQSELVRAIKNVIFNGIKYSFPMKRTNPPWIKIYLIHDKTDACVKIESWGVPITKKEIRSGILFQEGHRGELAKRYSRSGHGFGLSDVYNIVKEHNGEITVDSELASKNGNGAHINTFSIKLPFINAYKK
jgi:signal transduction histidine kinase